MTKEQAPNPSFGPKEHQGMRLLGNCPNCQKEDTIVVSQEAPGTPEGDMALCESCQTVWPDWLDLEAHPLIPVEIKRLRYDGEEHGVELSWPEKRDEIPQVNLVTSVLNAALLTKFNKLSVCFATEGGIEGEYKDTYLELRNAYDRLGLYSEYPDYQGGGLTEVLDFYEKMLHVLFVENFQVRNKKYRRGEILRLPSEEQTTGKIWEILMAMLVKVGGGGGRKFAQKVVQQITDNPTFSRLYLRGLTPEEIDKFFVPPPLTKDKEI